MKLRLPSVTLICVDGVNAQRAVNVLEHCKSLVDFGAVKLLTHFETGYEHEVKIMPLKSLIAYSVFCLTELHKYFDTSHVLIVQRDGWILNPQSWNNDWLQYDYIAPLFVQHDDVGSGGFSLRSKKIMEGAAKRYRAWDGTDADAHLLQNTIGSYEDGVLSLQMKYDGYKYAPLDEAGKFCQAGNRNTQYYHPHPLGFHGDKQNINHSTGFVSPVCSHGGEDCGCRESHLIELLRMEGK
jgi:hypothetical protein